MNKFISLLVTVLILFSSCTKTKNNKEFENAIYTGNFDTSLSNDIILTFDESDTLNPYTLKTASNKLLVPLIFDSLTKINSDYTMQKILASEILKFDNNVTIKLNKNIKFSDGSEIKSQDILFSYNLAKNNSSYNKNLKSIKSIEITNDFEFTLKLEQPNNMIEFCLDFPVIKKDSPNENYPLGSGKYIIVNQDNQKKLLPNPNNNSEKSKKGIILTENLNEDISLFNLNQGSLSALYFNKPINNINENVVIKKATPSNNIIYVGLNKNNSILSISKIRLAISTSIDRTNIVSKGFAGYGQLTYSPINPLITQNMNLPYHNFNTNLSNKILDELGFVQKNIYGIRNYKNENTQIELNILAPKQNVHKYLTANLIKEMLQKIGIKVNVVLKEFSDYLKDIKSGNYDMYIGETALSNDMDLSGLISKSELSNYFDISYELEECFNKFKAGKISTQEFCEFFQEKMPFIPLMFKKNVLLINRELNEVITPSLNNPYENIGN